MTLHRSGTLAIVLICGAWLTGEAIAQPGQLDPSFGTVGELTTSFSGGDRAEAVAIQPDGKVVIVGQTISAGDLATGDFAIARYNVDGTLDGSFGSGGKATTDFFGFNDGATAVALQADGKIVVAGFAYFSGSGLANSLALARYQANGILDPAFGTGGKSTLVKASYGLPYYELCQDVGVRVTGSTNVAIQSDGKILVGATIFDFSLGGFIGVARFEASGSLDTTFSAPAGCLPSTRARGVVLTRYLVDSVTFGIALQSDGKIVVAGNRNGNQQVELVRHLPSGALDTTFGTAGVATYPPPSFAITERGAAIAVQPDGKIIVAGSMFQQNYGTTYREAIEIKRYNVNGTPDTSFGSGGTVDTWVVQSGVTADAVAIDTAGNIVVAGCLETGGQSFSYCQYDGTVTDFFIARYTPQGALDRTFGGSWNVTDFFGFRDGATGIALQADGRIVAVGRASVDGAAQEHFAVARVLGGTVTCDATLSAPAASVGRARGSGTVTVSMPIGCVWTAQSNAPWIFVYPGAGSGSGVVTYWFAENSSTTPRVGTLTIAAKTFTLTQAASSPPTIQIQPTSVAVAVGQSAQFTVAATGDPVPTYQWQISTDGIAWVNVPTMFPYLGTLTTTLAISTASAGLSGNRYRAIATNTIGSATSNAATLTVTSSSCAYVVSVNEVVVSALGATSGVDLTTGATCAWTAASTDSWLTITPASGTGSARINYTVAAFSGTVQRTATLTVANKSVLFRQNGASSGLPEAPTSLTGSVTNRVLTLTWQAPVTGGTASGYVIEAGTATGLSDIASVPTGSSASVWSYSGVPDGRYYLRVRAQNLIGVGPASNEIQVTAGVGAPPAAPTALTGSITNGVLTLQWQSGISGGTVAGHVIEAGSSSGLSDIGAVPSGAGSSFQYIGVPPGRYFVRVKATNARGASAASNEVELTYGLVGIPGAPQNLLAQVTGGLLTLTWTAPVGPVTSYVIEAGTSAGVSNVATLNTGSTQTTWSYNGVPSGQIFHLRVRARNAAGQSLPSNEVSIGPAAAQGATPDSDVRARSELWSEVAGSQVQLAWTAPEGRAADRYLIEIVRAADLEPLPD